MSSYENVQVKGSSMDAALAVVLSFLSYGCVALLQIGSMGSDKFWLARSECDR